MHDRIIDPFIFIENTINSTNYLDMLELHVFSQIDDVPQIMKEKYICVIFNRMELHLITTLSAEIGLGTIDFQTIELAEMDRWIGTYKSFGHFLFGLH